MIVNIISNMNNQVTATCRGQLTVSALLMVTMLVCKACMSSLSVDGEIRQPSHEFTFGVGISFIPYPLVLTPVV
jgi:hypothetical protein